MIRWSLSPCRTVILAGESRSSIWVEVDAIPRSWFLMINVIIIDDQWHHHWWCWCWWWLLGSGRESRFVSTKGFCPTKSRLKVGSLLFLPFTFLFSLFICTLLLLTQRKEDVLVHDKASSTYFTWKIKWPLKQYCDIDQNCVLSSNWEAILFPYRANGTIKN